MGSSLPANQANHTVASGLWEAWKVFADPTAYILVVVEVTYRNQLGYRHVEFGVDGLSGQQARFIRLTLTECAERLSLGDAEEERGNCPLMVDGDKMVAVVYFRAGYSPTHFPTTKEWEARLLIERSSAIKCPSVGLLLANTKKVQQVLSNRTVLGRFFRDDCEEERGLADSVHSTFARMWGLAGCAGGAMTEEEAEIMQDAIADPHRFVLKSNREGGEGNYYGGEVAAKLKSLRVEERAAHILMQRLRPMVVKVSERV